MQIQGTHKIFLEDSFDSAHFLPLVPIGHKCRHLHGHTYKIKIELCGPLDNVMGWVVDYAEVKKAWDLIKDAIDHKLLNDIAGLENSTCELLAVWIWDRLKPALPLLSRIDLRETERCGVIYEG